MFSIDYTNLGSGFSLVLPEIFLCVSIVVLIVCNLFKANRSYFFVSLIAIAAHLAFGNYHDIFKIVVSLAGVLTIILSGRNQRVEFYLFITSILLGADLLMSGDDFIMILLSMELISISSYVLTSGNSPNKQRAEAAWKFFIYGSVATAVMIFGMTHVYGATGNISIRHIPYGDPYTFIGVVLMLAGFLFKMTAVPLHLWAPDVYESAPAPVVAFLSVVPKIAAFNIIYYFIAWSDAAWRIPLCIFSIVSIIVGTLAALNQTNSKRMMAYSSVAQAGFLLIIPATASLPSLANYYLVVFAVMNYLVFIVIHQKEISNGGVAFSDFNGIGYTSPVAAVAITLGLVSLAGLPPMAGFMAKLFVFSAVWTKYTSTENLAFLALFLVGLLATVASLYFYLKIPFYAFFRRSEENQPIKISLFTNLLLIILVGLLLAFFLAPGLLMG